MDVEISCNKGLLTFTKMKDSETPKPIEFKLLPVEIGTDEETGEVITSCVPVYGERSERSKKVNYTRIEAMAINALIIVSANEQRITENVYVANTEAWRKQFYETRKAEDFEVSSDALRQDFYRSVKGLSKKEAIEQIGSDSFLLSEDCQVRIGAAILANTMLLNKGVAFNQSVT
jgi:hypothetical protein